MLVSDCRNEKRTNWITVIPKMTCELVATIKKVIRAVINAFFSFLGYTSAEQKKALPVPVVQTPPTLTVVQTPPTLPIVQIPPTPQEKTWAQFAWDHKGKIAIVSLVVIGLSLAIWYGRASELDIHDDLLDRINKYSELVKNRASLPEVIVKKVQQEPKRLLGAFYKPHDPLPDF